MTRPLESFYDLTDEIPRNHGGRYIPTAEEREAWDRQDFRRLSDEAFHTIADQETRAMLDYQETIDSIIAGTRPR